MNIYFTKIQQTSFLPQSVAYLSVNSLGHWKSLIDTQSPPLVPHLILGFSERYFDLLVLSAEI